MKRICASVLIALASLSSWFLQTALADTGELTVYVTDNGQPVSDVTVDSNLLGS